jgi:hypothetical protein
MNIHKRKAFGLIALEFNLRPSVWNFGVGINFADRLCWLNIFICQFILERA